MCGNLGKNKKKKCKSQKIFKNWDGRLVLKTT